ncbi:MAG: hypothetical protein P4M07_18675 [Xanthobacteraceae bacterium]|nr:hypothetical protein [Xanthobacteraceae bacterium]
MDFDMFFIFFSSGTDIDFRIQTGTNHITGCSGIGGDASSGGVVKNGVWGHHEKASIGKRVAGGARRVGFCVRGGRIDSGEGTKGV